ncbi:MAG: YtxH domain-containing protein [Chloroflexota bacterium]|nr:MAG: YtxH domain-containing protein [Chloroflexota bacterium]
MLRKIATAVPFFLIGWMVGLMTAPRTGSETRKLLAREIETLGKPERIKEGEEFSR